MKVPFPIDKDLNICNSSNSPIGLVRIRREELRFRQKVQIRNAPILNVTIFTTIASKEATTKSTAPADSTSADRQDPDTTREKYIYQQVG